jgi:hypothetical protein
VPRRRRSAQNSDLNGAYGSFRVKEADMLTVPRFVFAVPRERRLFMRKFTLALVIVAALVAAVPAVAATTVPYQATYVEPVGGPNQSPFSCPPGTSCGSASFSGIGHASYQVVTFNACGFGCHLRTVTFDDGSTLLIQVEDQPSGFAFTSPGNSGSHGYIGLPGVGNPQFLEIKETILSGTGRLAGASGSGTGTVKLHGGVAIGKTSGTITLC